MPPQLDGAGKGTAIATGHGHENTRKRESPDETAAHRTTPRPRLARSFAVDLDDLPKNRTFRGIETQPLLSFGSEIGRDTRRHIERKPEGARLRRVGPVPEKQRAAI